MNSCAVSKKGLMIAQQSWVSGLSLRFCGLREPSEWARDGSGFDAEKGLLRRKRRWF